MNLKSKVIKNSMKKTERKSDVFRNPNKGSNKASHIQIIEYSNTEKTLSRVSSNSKTMTFNTLDNLYFNAQNRKNPERNL